MIIRKLDDILGTEQEVLAPNKNWCSRRFLTEQDGMGFSLTDTLMFAGTRTLIHYKHHLEACYCVEGTGQLELVDQGRTVPLKVGTMYALNENEKHYLVAKTDLRLVCVFNPPLSGDEVHREDGSYAELQR
jgi:L-ectoine synthase